MPKLHIVQGGIENGDKAWLEKAARRKIPCPSWIAPKSVRENDDVVIYVGGYGFFATARVTAPATRRRDWKNRYGAPLDSIKLIEPAISLGIIQDRVPRLRWANYPRSITTVAANLASGVRRLIKRRHLKGAADLDQTVIARSSLDELRALAMLNAKKSVPALRRMVNVRLRSRTVHLYVLRRAEGYCEGCGQEAPFDRSDGEPYLEPHHTRRLADEGPDDPRDVIALCPNCHARVHRSADGVVFNRSLVKKLSKLEP